jgi:arylsulfatase A-like enzyme
VSRRSRAIPHLVFVQRVTVAASQQTSQAISRRGIWPVWVAASFGLLTGLIELLVLVVRHRVEVSSALGALQMNRHFPWMVPLSHLVVFGLAGVPVSLMEHVAPRAARKVAVLVPAWLSGFALLSLIQGLFAWASAILALGIAVRMTTVFERRERGFRRAAKLSMPLFLAILGFTGLYCYDKQVLQEARTLTALPKPAGGLPNVLLIVLDTVRADHLSLYGYERETTPSLKRWAQRGVVFDEARSSAPWTFPSHCTLFTGRWPSELNIGGNRPLDATYPTLAETLARCGYATAGFVGNTYYCNSWYGLARGFAHYEDYYEENVIVSPAEALRCTALGRWLIRLFGAHYNVRPEAAIAQKDAERVNRDFLRWTSAHADRPFFAFLNYVDAHDPYSTPLGYPHHFGLVPMLPDEHHLIQNWHTRDKSNLSPRQMALIRDAYDDCLYYLDDHLNRLFSELDRRGILANTIVAVVSDHGEELGDHGLYEHGQSLYRAETRVPFLLFGQRAIPAGQRISAPVSLRDIPATLLGAAGASESSELPGTSLARHWRSRGELTAATEDLVISEAAIHRKPSQRPSRKVAPSYLGPMTSTVLGNLEYIRDGFGDEELYDFVADPGERTNLAGLSERTAELEQVRRLLNQVRPTVIRR